MLVDNSNRHLVAAIQSLLYGLSLLWRKFDCSLHLLLSTSLCRQSPTPKNYKSIAHNLIIPQGDKNGQ